MQATSKMASKVLSRALRTVLASAADCAADCAADGGPAVLAPSTCGADLAAGAGLVVMLSCWGNATDILGWVRAQSASGELKALACFAGQASAL